MNIICNTCVGARLYEVTKQQFPNQFMWMKISPDDFIKLINDYDTIDFQHPNIGLEKYLKHSCDSILITLSNGVKLHYIHYIQDNLKLEPTRSQNINILFCDILGYAKTKWFKRLARNIEVPTFLFSFDFMKTKDDVTYEKIFNKLLQIKDKNLIIVVHDNITFSTNNTPPNIKIIKCNSNIMTNGTTSAVANNIKTQVFNNE